MERSVLACECKESIYEGLPCRHELCVYIKDTLDIENLHIQQRWTRDYFEEKELSEDSSSEGESEEDKQENRSEEDRNNSSDIDIEAKPNDLNQVFLIITLFYSE